MKIQKRDGRFEQLSFDKIVYRLRKLCSDKSLGVLHTIDPDVVAQKVASGIYDGVTSRELDEEAARVAVSMTENLEYQKLASRIIISNLHKTTNECFSEVMEKLYNNKDKSGHPMPVIADDVMCIIRANKNVLNFAIDYARDYMFDYFGFKTLEKGYLQKLYNNDTGKMEVVERPQHLYMRVAVGIHKDDIESALKTYDYVSQHYYTHASPTMFNAGTRLANLSSCFHEDTIVATVNRGPVKIKDVQLGDQVVTHQGNVKHVLQLHRNALSGRKLFEIEVSKTNKVKVTDNHKLWAVQVAKRNTERRTARTYYDINFVKQFLEEDNCRLLTAEYRNMKTKLDFICMCGKQARASFESIYYHGVRCNDRRCIYSRSNRKPCKDKTFNTPRWVSVSELQPGDYIGIPNKIQNVEYNRVLDVASFRKLVEEANNRKFAYSVTFDEHNVVMKTHWTHHVDKPVDFSRQHVPVRRYWDIDERFAKFVGIFYGDGHIMTAKDRLGGTVIRGIGITIHNTNLELLAFCSTFGENTFGLIPTIHAMSRQNVVQVLFNSSFIGHVFLHLFGHHFNNKHLWPEIFKWNKQMVVSLLEGLITTGGCVTRSGAVMLQMSNVKFMRDLHYLLRNNNIDASYGVPKFQKGATAKHVQINIPISATGLSNLHKCYTESELKVPKRFGNQHAAIEFDGFKFLKLEKKTEMTTDLPEFVYTLGVEDDHSYNVEGLVAENCFLLGTEDSIEGIYKTIADCGRISKVGGGVGVHITNVRARGSIIRGTNGMSDGIVPMIKVYNSTAAYINQSGRRKGSFAMYIEPWHADVVDFLDLKKNQGHDDVRARDLFYALWTPDLFMRQVENDGDWYLMCPDECPGLTDTYGDKFEQLYWKYVDEKRYKKVVKAQDVWKKILESQIETGTPYIGYKDAVNKKCNQKNLGTIKSSNLCMEISLYSDSQEYAVCNLCSIALPRFVLKDEAGNPFFDFEKLREVAHYVIKPMNRVIDNNYYPTEEAKASNFKHRPIGVGVQGLADVYFKMKLPFESKEAHQLNKDIFETVYFGCLQGATELAKVEGKYESFDGSPFSQGKLQFDLAAEHDGIDLEDYLSGRWDWEGLKSDLVKYGASNSMLTALMPTASSAQIMGNSECFEAIDSCIFKRRVLSGEYMVVNKYLVSELDKLGLWSREMKDTIIAHGGSVQGIPEIPDDIKAVYKTVWEISMKSVIEQCRDRGVFVDQMQSMNLFMANPNYRKLTSMHFHAFKQNLKSGMYYLRSKGSYQSGKFSIDAELENKIREKQEKGKGLTQDEERILCSIDNKEACMACSS